eukprot:3165649-Rhodomonas_salina.2
MQPLAGGLDPRQIVNLNLNKRAIMIVHVRSSGHCHAALDRTRYRGHDDAHRTDTACRSILQIPCPFEQRAAFQHLAMIDPSTWLKRRRTNAGH